MTRCHECGIISKESAVPAAKPAPGYLLGGGARRALTERVRAARERVRVLEVVVGAEPERRLVADERLSVTTLDPSVAGSALERIEPASFDAVFVNGFVEQVREPVTLLKTLGAGLKAGGTLTIVAASADVTTLPRDEAHLPGFAYTPATLSRLAIAAGYRPETCGLLFRPVDAMDTDPRLSPCAHLHRTHRLLAMLGRSSGVASGLLELHATGAADADARPKLSVIMPVFNEARTFSEIFERVASSAIAGVDREIILVESNSTDGSRELVRAVEKRPGVKVIYQDRPSGKGHAVRAGLAAATGDIFLIQDADLEYDVDDYDIVLEPLLNLSTTFVLGSRHMGRGSWKIRQFADSRLVALVMNLAHEFFTAMVNRLYQQDLRDPTTMFKVFRRECFGGMAFRRDRFDFDFELVCKLIRRGHVPIEVPINYHSRSFAEGKKVRFFRDPITWLRTIVASRFEPLFPS
jgi:hypothetical protein